MSKYYYTDGKERFGPFTQEELATKNITRETLVWMEGLTDWMPAGNVSELQSLFPAAIPQTSQAGASYPDMMWARPPKNWLVESILVTLFCCIPFGIVGIVFATRVESLWNSGQRDAAVKASRDAGKWVRIGFICGIVSYVIGVLYILIAMYAVFQAPGTNQM